MRTLLVLGLVLVLSGCGGDFEVRLGVPSASDFADPVPVRVADVQIGTTAETGLGPDDRPVVTLRIDPAHRDRLREDTVFVLERERFGTGPLYVKAIPGEGEPVGRGHWYEARSTSLTDQARQLWRRILDDADGGRIRERMDELSAEIDSAAASGRERWQEVRPRLEARAEELVAQVREESVEASESLRRWFENALDEAERTVEGEREAQ